MKTQYISAFLLASLLLRTGNRASYQDGVFVQSGQYGGDLRMIPSYMVRG